MKKTAAVGLLAASALLAVSVAACGNKSSDTSSDKKVNVSKLPLKVSNTKKAVKGGTLKVALVDDSPIKGLFNSALSSDTYDELAMSFANESLFKYDKGYKIIDGGAADMKLDKDANTVTISINPKVKWSDGQALTADDVIYAYEVIASKDYTGVRYDDSIQEIKGIKDYNAGTASSISGLEKKDDQTVVIHYDAVTPGMTNTGNGYYLEFAIPKHYYSDVAIKDLEKSDKVRKTPLFFGPFKMSKVVAGESVEYTRNEYYYGGQPKLEKVELSVVPSSSIVASLKANKYDLALQMPTDTYDTYKSLDGYTNLGQPQLAYTYIGFKLGKWDAAAGKNVMDPDSKMADKSLRQAMGYAMNNAAIGSKFYSGLRTNATTLIPPIFADYHDTSSKGYTLNIKKAKALLDKAGYKDVTGDGYREDKNGKKLTIKFASMSGGETAEPIAQNYIQQWKKIGLKVELATGRLIEFNSFYDKLQADDKDFDVFQAAWSLSSEPSPSGLYSENAQFNYTRFVTEKNNELLADIDSAASFDATHRKEAFDKWQEYMVDQAPVIPTLYRTAVYPVSSRVKNFDITNGTATTSYGVTDYAKVEVTSK